ncbi:hypothetical protein EV702DRAFT_1203335 [Suillus placidus]|uniref:Uncharacterized protein n=1 Tax=Suillus placidus TaxID=48579 RepID=A0A9P6ZIY1_9AGAM|nr:hypothetical protein EV702DRAFT_1203335 [Suillus placidus]
MAGEAFDPTYFRTGKFFDEYFDNDGKLRIQVEGVRGLEQALESYKVVADDELSLCTSFLRLMLFTSTFTYTTVDSTAND